MDKTINLDELMLNKDINKKKSKFIKHVNFIINPITI